MMLNYLCCVKLIMSHLCHQDHAQVAEANTILMHFVETELAWVWCLKLLRSFDDQFVQYFAANMLLTKARRHWCQLMPQQQEEVYQDMAAFIQEYVSGVSSDGGNEQVLSFMKTFINRLSLCFAVLSCQHQRQSSPPARDAAPTSGVEIFMKFGIGTSFCLPCTNCLRASSCSSFHRHPRTADEPHTAGGGGEHRPAGQSWFAHCLDGPLVGATRHGRGGGCVKSYQASAE